MATVGSGFHGRDNALGTWTLSHCLFGELLDVGWTSLISLSTSLLAPDVPFLFLLRMMTGCCCLSSREHAFTDESIRAKGWPFCEQWDEWAVTVGWTWQLPRLSWQTPAVTLDPLLFPPAHSL